MRIAYPLFTKIVSKYVFELQLHLQYQFFKPRRYVSVYLECKKTGLAPAIALWNLFKDDCRAGLANAPAFVNQPVRQNFGLEAEERVLCCGALSASITAFLEAFLPNKCVSFFGNVADFTKQYFGKSAEFRGYFTA